MRGKVRLSLSAALLLRITPAHAGKRHTREVKHVGFWDHPRACGEKTSVARSQPRTAGSPPRMRGKGQRPRRSYPFRRITPAHAGKRRRASACTLLSWDHPRACGEKTKKIP